MDCRTALEILEVVRPDSADFADAPRDGSRNPATVEAAVGTSGVNTGDAEADAGFLVDFTAAVAHLDEHPDCRAVFENRQSLDRRIGAVVRDVDVPTGLKDRLLATVAAASTCDFTTDSTAESAVELSESTSIVTSTGGLQIAEPPVPLHRRTWVRTTVAAAAGVLIAFVLVQFRSDPQTAWHLADLQAEIPVSGRAFDELLKFDGGFKAELPMPLLFSELGEATAPARGFIPKDSEGDGHRVALVPFRLNQSGRGVFAGVVAIVPKASIVDPPSADDFFSSGYETSADGAFAVKAWTSSNFVYIAYVEGSGRTLEELQSALRGPSV